VRMQPAISAWPGANAPGRIEPDAGNDGFGLLACKVTNPSTGVWHYDYAVYNQTLIVPFNPSVCLLDLELL
jgi:hypothetical protein